ncbi:MAG TPA: MmgE/PrpD family protein [Steroidobacteraceae bacterium]|nr:MmgE/PrpD family protein [Steroidobacteraceae bacterium]
MAVAHAALANQDVAEFAARAPGGAPAADDGAYGALLDALARALAALADADCARLLGPIVPGATMARGARIPGTSHELDPVAAAFCIGAAACWTGPADPAGENFGALFAVLDYRSRRAHDRAEAPPRVAELLCAIDRARCIQSALEREADYPGAAAAAKLAVRVASAAVAANLLGGSIAQVATAATLAWLDGGPLPAHPRAPPIAARAGWAAADSTSRGLRLALLAIAADGGPALATPARRSAPFAAGAAAPPPDPRAALERFAASLDAHFGARRTATILRRVTDRPAFVAMPVHEFTALIVHNA